MGNGIAHVFAQNNFTVDLVDVNKNSLNNSIKINDRLFKVPNILINNNITKFSDADIKDALIFNRNLLIESFIIPNKLRFPLSRNILEKYFWLLF